MLDGTTDVSSTSPEPISASDALASLSETEHQEWRQTGTLPADKFTSPHADPTPAEPAEQAASTDVRPEAASEPAKKTKKNADTRVDELLADRAAERQRAERAERELAELRRGTQDAKPAAPSPAPAKADTEPTVDQFTTYEQFVKAQARWEVRQELQADKAEGQRQFQQQEFYKAQSQRVSTFVEKMNAAKVADPTFTDRISSEVASMKTVAKALADGERLTVNHAIAEEIVDSSVPTELLVHLSENPADLAILRAAKDKPDLKRLIGRLEGRLERTASPSPTTRTVTQAPAPPTTLGTRPAASADSVESAIKRGDVGAYMREMNAREVAARK